MMAKGKGYTRNNQTISKIRGIKNASDHIKERKNDVAIFVRMVEKVMIVVDRRRKRKEATEAAPGERSRDEISRPRQGPEPSPTAVTLFCPAEDE